MPSISIQVFVQNLSYENDLDLHENEPATENISIKKVLH